MRGRRIAVVVVVILLVAAAAAALWFVVSHRGEDSYASALAERQRRWDTARPNRWERPGPGEGAAVSGNAAEAQSRILQRLADGPEGPFYRLGRLDSPLDRVISSGELDAAARTLVEDRESELAELRRTTRRAYSWDPDQYILPTTRLATVRLLALAALATDTGGECFDAVAATVRVFADSLPGHEPEEEEARAAGVILFAGLTCADRASAEELRAGLDAVSIAAAWLPRPADRIEALLHARGTTFDDAVAPSALTLLYRGDTELLDRRRELLETWDHMLVEARFWRRNRGGALPALLDRAASTQRSWRSSSLPMLQGQRLLEAVALEAAIAAMLRVLVVATDAARLLEEEGRLDVAPPTAADPRWSDPFSADGSPLLFLSQEAVGHSLVYSVGPNRRDDHGGGDDFAAPIAPR